MFLNLLPMNPLTRYLCLVEGDDGGAGGGGGGGAGGDGGGGTDDGKGSGGTDDGKGGSGGGTNLPDDPAELRKMVADLRKESAGHRVKVKELEPLAARLKELEDADKTEAQKLTGKLTETEKRAEAAELKALRLEVAHDKGFSSKHLRYLTGTTKEELEANADQVLEDFGGDTSSSSSKGGPGGRPRERLRGGSNPVGDDDAPDIAEIVKSIRR